MHFYSMPVWKEAPFVRLFIPFATGTYLQWSFKLPVNQAYAGITICCVFLILFSLKTISSQFKQSWVSGVLFNGIFFFAGLMMTFFKNAQNDPGVITRQYLKSSTIIATLEEPLVYKPNSYKALASVNVLKTSKGLFFPKGNIIIYFQKDSLTGNKSSSKRLFGYGSRIAFHKNLQLIKNTGNPGSFDYGRYCAFQKIYYQVYLKAGEYRILPRKSQCFRQIIFKTRSSFWLFCENIFRDNKESGLAEAF